MGADPYCRGKRIGPRMRTRMEATEGWLIIRAECVVWLFMTSMGDHGLCKGHRDITENSKTGSHSYPTHPPHHTSPSSRPSSHTTLSPPHVLPLNSSTSPHPPHTVSFSPPLPTIPTPPQLPPPPNLQTSAPSHLFPFLPHPPRSGGRIETYGPADGRITAMRSVQET